MAESNFDLIVIGAGPGGYTGAIRAAQLGLKVAVVEKDKTFGGTCLNVGCIPSKALLDSSEHFAAAQHEFGAHGIKVGKVELDLNTMMKRKEKIVKDLTGGIAGLFKKNKIESFVGTGQLASQTEVDVIGADGQRQRISGKNIMLAAGSVPVELPNLKFDGQRVVSSTEALSLARVPQHLIVIGGGVIGVELGSVWLRLGSKVTVVEYGPKICGGADAEMSTMLLRVLKKQGMEFMLSTRVTGAATSGDGVEIQFESLEDKKTGALKGDVVLVAAGRRAFPDKLGLGNAGVKTDDRGRVLVDDRFRTNVANIFAIGDLIRGPMLAHKAEEEGVAVAEILAGLPGHVNYETVPGVVYTWPELASVGLTEEQAKESGKAYKVGAFPFVANGRAKAMGMTDGKVKIIADAATDRVIGVHILGPRASDMIAEAVVVMEFGGSSEDIARSFHGHPTLSEVVREAALAVDKRARQI